MTITIPSEYTITTPGALALPMADALPLEAALKNANAFYSLQRPALRSVVYTDASPAAVPRAYRLAVYPSSDGIAYRFRHVIRTGAGATAIDITVQWQTAGGGWTTIYSASTAIGASTVDTVAHTATIPAAADELRITYDRGGDDYMADSVLITPEPVAPAARTSAGMWPYDDGLLAAAGAPINTELLTRSWRNTRAIIVDRVQNLASFTQRADTDAVYDLTTTSSPDGAWVRIGTGVAAVPYAPASMGVEVTVIADGAIATADRVRVIAGGIAATLDADGTVQSAVIDAPVTDAGTMQASIPIEVWGLADSGDALYVWDVAAHGVPVSPPAALPIAAVDPPATVALLATVIREVERRCMRQWAQPALMYDGVTDQTERRWWASIPPACQRARMAIVRGDRGTGTLQADTTIETTTTSGVPAPAGDEVTLDTPTRGTLAYLDAAGGQSKPVVLWSSGSYDVDGVPPGTSCDRQIELPEARAPDVEEIEVAYSCGAALHLVRVRPPADYWQIA